MGWFSKRPNWEKMKIMPIMGKGLPTKARNCLGSPSASVKKSKGKQKPPSKLEKRHYFTVKRWGLTLQIGAGEGIRTLDPNLGKVVLYP